jgi:hypothetical protein
MKNILRDHSRTPYEIKESFSPQHQPYEFPIKIKQLNEINRKLPARGSTALSMSKGVLSFLQNLQPVLIRFERNLFL